MKFFLPEPAVDQHVAILGKTGSGKSWTARLLVEHVLHLKRQVCVLDPTGAWFGLRLGADGKGKGFDVVLLGGEHADIPLAERSGAAVARLVTEQGASVVLDTSGMTVGEYTRWFIDFAGTLYTTLRSPLHLIIDEAHHFMPQSQGRVDVDQGKMLHAGNRLMSGGRSRGVRGTLITQRPAKLHKDSLTCADTLIAMRVVAPQDRKAYKDWIDGAGNPEQGAEVLDSLAGLKRGEGWVWYPEGGYLERWHFPAIKTYDSMAAPKGGAKAAVTLAEIDLGEVQKAMADAVKEAEANDPKLLRKKIAELEGRLKARPAETKTVEVEKIVEVPVLKNGQLDRTEKVIGRLEAIGEKVTSEAAELRRLIVPAFQKPAVPSFHRKPVSFHPASTPTPKQVQSPHPKAESSQPGEITPRQQRFLDAAAALTTLGADVTRETVAAWVGVHPRGGSVGEELKALADAGLIGLDRGRIVVSDAGFAAAGTIDPTEAIERAKSGLTNRQRQFFEVIVAAYPGDRTREEIAAQFNLHPRGGSLGEDLGRLIGRGLVEGQRGRYRARDFLFAGTQPT